MSPVARFPTRSVVAVLALVLVVTAPFADERRTVAAVGAGIGATDTLAVATCDPADGPPLWSRFSGIGFVYLGTGGFAFETVDVGGSDGMARTFTRAYNSKDTRTTLLGPGWMHNFEVRLRGDGSGDLLFTLPNGNVERFKGGRDSGRTVGTSRGYRVLTWESSAGPYIVSDGSTTWTLGGTGSLIRADGGAGDWVELSYEGGHPAMTTGPHGLGLRFEIGAGDRLTRVVDAADDSKFVDYAFDRAGRLIRAAPSNAAARVYSYAEDSQRITTISDDAGAVLLSVEYDDETRVIREKDVQGLLDGEAVTFAYEKLSGGKERTTVTYPPSVIEPDWHPIQIVTHDAAGRMLELELRPTSTETVIGRYDYDAQNRTIVLQDPCTTSPVAEPSAGIIQSIWGFVQTLLRFFAR